MRSIFPAMKKYKFHLAFIFVFIALVAILIFSFSPSQKEFDCANLENYSVEPAIAYYVKDFACILSGLDDKSRVEVIVWPNGKIIWSSVENIDDTEVIKYYISTISKKRLSAALAKIEAIREDKLSSLEAIHEDNYFQYSLIAFDFPVNYIYINQANNKRIKLGICFEDSVSENEDKEIGEFRIAWKDVKAIVQDMIPKKGREIHPVFTYPSGI